MSDTRTSGSSIIPTFRYKDAHKGIEWLVQAFGFQKRAVFDGPNGTVAHAELTLGNGMIMLGSASNQGGSANMALPEEIGGRQTMAPYLIVPDATAVHEQAKAAGAVIVMELQEMSYGGKAFACTDPEGFHWSFGEYDPWNTVV
jgi:uncharacterized glyoxalase superfamily protein PhnB